MKPNKEQLIITARNLATVHSLLQQGIYSGAAYKDLQLAVPFIEELHKQVMTDLEPMLDNPEEAKEAGDTNE